MVNFARYVESMRLNDVRSNGEKIVEAIVLGERMQSILLYDEGYVHGVGKYEEILQSEGVRFSSISPHHAEENGEVIVGLVNPG